MRKVTVSAKTVDEAISKALQQLEATQDQIIVTVIDEPAKGLFGLIGARPAVVEVEVKEGAKVEEKVQEKRDPIEEGKKFLTNLMEMMGVKGNIEIFKRDEAVTLNLMGSSIGILIGHHGQTLDSLQNLVNAVVNRYTDEYVRVIVDAENYREKRKATLEELAGRLARKAARTKQAVKLEPMNAHERKIIHTYLQDDPYIETYSEGEEPRRYIVITNKRK